MSSCCQLFLTQWPLVMIGLSWGICVAALSHLGEKYSLEQVDLNGINCWIAIHVAALGQPTKIYECFDEKNHGEFWWILSSICGLYHFTFCSWILKSVCCKEWNFCAPCILHVAFSWMQYEGPVWLVAHSWQWDMATWPWNQPHRGGRAHVGNLTVCPKSCLQSSVLPVMTQVCTCHSGRAVMVYLDNLPRSYSLIHEIQNIALNSTRKKSWKLHMVSFGGSGMLVECHQEW